MLLGIGIGICGALFFHRPSPEKSPPAVADEPARQRGATDAEAAKWREEAARWEKRYDSVAAELARLHSAPKLAPNAAPTVVAAEPPAERRRNRFLDKQAAPDTERTSAYRYIKYMAARPYRAYRAYRAYQQGAENDGMAAGTEDDCRRFPFAVICHGTPVFCAAEPGAPECEGTQGDCEANPTQKICQGTEAFCVREPGSKACAGTAIWCLRGAGRVADACAGMKELCETDASHPACHGTAANCAAAGDVSPCEPDRK
jgi:hypothetical protein